MKPTTTKSRRLAATLLVAGSAVGAALCSAPSGLADPGPAAPVVDSATPTPVADPAPGAAPAPDAAVVAAPADGVAPSESACKAFSSALNFAATNYEDFAYDSAGDGNSVNYGDPTVQNSNVTGRTALRQAAGAAMEASNTPGLQPDISSPMRAWSLRATKLLLVMGLHGGGDRLNNTATDMNADAHDVQMACAYAGTAV